MFDISKLCYWYEFTVFAICRLKFVFSPGSVKADILVKTFQDTDDSVRKRLKEEVDKAKIGNLAVDRYFYSIEPVQGMALHAVTQPKFS